MTSPLHPDQMTPAWLSNTLAASGFQDSAVAAFSTTRIGTGQTGACARVHLRYQSANADGPDTLVAKFASDSELSRESAVAMGIYRRELEFYRDVAPGLNMRLPRCYALEIDARGAQFLILMDDLAPAEPGDQLAGCSVAVARQAVLELVGLQSATWCDATLGERFKEPEDGFFSDMHGLYNQMLPAFVERFGPRLAADELAIIEQLGDSPRAPLFSALGTPFCLEHRDYRLDNFLIDNRAAEPKVAIVDWQGMRTGRPLNDVVLCLAGGLASAERRQHEQAILRDYHSGLLAAGVKDFDWEQCWREYRRASFAGFGLTVVASIAVEQTTRGDDMFTAMAQRHARHALDLNAAEFL
ncbi:MAG: phosphotransferase [Pseudomonadales bacterium]